MSAIPLLSDIQSTKTRYQAGDRVICKVQTHITAAQYDRLRKSIREFAGADVNLLIVNTSRFHVVRARRGEQNLILAQISEVTGEARLGVANVSLAKVDLLPGDQLIVLTPKDYPEKQCRNAFKIWAGDDVEVVVAQ